MRESVEEIEEAGIRLSLFSQKHRYAAIPIALDAGVIDEKSNFSNSKYAVMDGKDFHNLVEYVDEAEAITVKNLSNLQLVRNELRLLSEADSTELYLLVEGYQKCGDVVMLVTQSRKDSSSLYKANVGVIIYNNHEYLDQNPGTDVILLKEGISTVIEGIKWSRSFLFILQKITMLQICASVVGFVCNAVGFLLFDEILLKLSHVLWANVVISLILAFGLQQYPSTSSVKECNKSTFITKEMKKHLAV